MRFVYSNLFYGSSVWSENWVSISDDKLSGLKAHRVNTWNSELKNCWFLPLSADIYLVVSLLWIHLAAPSASSGSTPGSPKSAATRSPISATVVLATPWRHLCYLTISSEELSHDLVHELLRCVCALCRNLVTLWRETFFCYCSFLAVLVPCLLLSETLTSIWLWVVVQ